MESVNLLRPSILLYMHFQEGIKIIFQSTTETNWKICTINLISKHVLFVLFSFSLLFGTAS